MKEYKINKTRGNALICMRRRNLFLVKERGLLGKRYGLESPRGPEDGTRVDKYFFSFAEKHRLIRLIGLTPTEEKYGLSRLGERLADMVIRRAGEEVEQAFTVSMRWAL